MENNIDLNYLLHGHIAGSLSDQEKLQLIQFLDNGENVKKWNGLIGKLYEETAGDASGYRDEEVEKMIQFILNYSVQKTSQPPVHRIHFLKTAWFRYAAAAILVIGVAAYLRNTQEKKNAETAQSNPVPVQNDVLPGSDKAILTLSNGQKVMLDSTAQQTITDGKLSINNKNGMLTYGKSAIVVYNTISTPKGGQYRLTLPDGTSVWLNAASSITYPTAFPGKDRMVSITGEAYFEVAKNLTKPFTVKTYKDEITVLGTSFNVNSYQDESIVKTSLLEGAVRIGDKVLKPGQAYLDGKVTETNLDQDLAWKNGVFNFNKADLPAVMRQLSRWYDIEVEYPSTLADKRFGGKMGRDLTLLQVLKLLNGVDMHFRLEDRTIVATP